MEDPNSSSFVAIGVKISIEELCSKFPHPRYNGDYDFTFFKDNGLDVIEVFELGEEEVIIGQYIFDVSSEPYAIPLTSYSFNDINLRYEYISNKLKVDKDKIKIYKGIRRT